jgi:hypothetical protein
MRSGRALFLAALLPLAAQASTIRGDYLESRTADVWTGPCFANGEVNLTGQEAILAWRVREGAWLGVALEGLSVVAVVQAQATLGDPHADPYPARSVLLVDEKATEAQRDALVAFAREMGGRLLEDVVSVQSAPIALEVAGHGAATLRAGEVASLATRCVRAADKHCGNEVVYYPPLTQVHNAQPAVATEQAYRGSGLDSRWSCPDKRSAFLAEFKR